MPTRLEAFLSIEEGLAKKLTASWHKVASDVFADVKRACDDTDFARAHKLIEALDLSPVIEDNRPAIRYFSYAAFLFGATRLTENAQQTVVASGAYDSVVAASVKLMERTILGSVKDQIQDVLTEYVEEREAPWQHVALSGFDPNQPRDEQGRWTSTGVSPSIGPSDPVSPAHHNFVQELTDKIVKLFKYEGQVTVTDEHETFVLNGETHSYGGSYNMLTGELKINTRAVREASHVNYILSHEIGHAKFSSWLEATKREEEAFLEAARRQERGEQVTLPPTPNMDMQARLLLRERKEFEKDDGVTAYSRLWWEAAKKEPNLYLSAVNETIAEIHRVRAEGRKGDKFAGTKRWQELMQQIDKAQTVAVQFARRANIGRAIRDAMYVAEHTRVKLAELGHATVDYQGGKAIVVYLNDAWEWVPAKKDAVWIKLLGDDGSVAFLRGPRTQVQKYDENQPRDELGRWTTTGQGSTSRKGFNALLIESRYDQEHTADDLFSREYAEWAENLRDEQRTALMSYVGEGYQDINDHLRLGEDKSKPDDIVKEIKDTIKDIDSALADAPPVKEDFFAYRGVSDRVAGLLLDAGTEGIEIVDNGFASLSLAPAQAANFTRKYSSETDYGTVFQIKVPKGSGGAYVTALDTPLREHEFLLPRGSRFRVTGVIGKTVVGVGAGGSKRYANLVEAELLPPTVKKADIVEIGGSMDRGNRFMWGEADIVIRTTKEKYDENQPRDELGRWTTEGATHAYSKERGWHRTDGGETSQEDAGRLARLKIPPAWTDVRLNPNPDGALQAIGKDVKGRVQYRYSAEHSERAAAEKFARLMEFHSHVQNISNSSLRDMQNVALSQSQRDAAAVTYLIDQTGFRVGSTADTGADKQAYGATTLLGKHVKIDGDKIAFKFTGKKGVDITKTIHNSALAEYLRDRKDRPNDRLFQTSGSSVNEYLKSVSSPDFSIKDYRTYHGTRVALDYINKQRIPKSEKEYKKQRNEVGKRVAAFLGNTPTVALASYIDPAVFKSWGPAPQTKKKVEPDDWATMQEFFETHSYDKYGNWRRTPETAFDPDDDEDTVMRAGLGEKL